MNGNIRRLICGVALATSLLLTLELILSSGMVSYIGGVYAFTFGVIFASSIAYFIHLSKEVS